MGFDLALPLPQVRAVRPRQKKEPKLNRSERVSQASSCRMYCFVASCRLRGRTLTSLCFSLRSAAVLSLDESRELMASEEPEHDISFDIIDPSCRYRLPFVTFEPSERGRTDG